MACRENGRCADGEEVMMLVDKDYAILYAADFPLARSLVWNVPTIGILMNVAGLLLK
jgi:uncharacterized MAPEG superfamily protein